MPVAVDSEGHDCCTLSTGYGLTPFDWQRNALIDSMGVRLDGRWASPRVGWSVSRQNGKNGGAEIFELHVMAMLGMRVLHSAHEVKTARKAFKRLLDFFDNPRLYPELAGLVKEIRRTNGQEAIELHNGGSVEFLARTKASGRGYSADVLVLDEAQELTDDELEAMLPTISASGNPMVFLLGTPPKPNKPATVWRRFRQSAVDGTDPDLCWIEYGVAPDADFAARESWAQGNPGAPESISWDTIAGEFAAMSLEGFAAERLGVWFATSVASQVIDMNLWATLTDSSVEMTDTVAYSLEVALGRGSACVGAAWRGPSKPHAQVAKQADGLDWIVPFFEAAAAKRRVTVTLDGGTEALSFVPALEAAGITVLTLKGADRPVACAGLYDLALSSGLTHDGQDSVTAALGGAEWRTSTEGSRSFARKGHADISPLYAIALALHGLTHGKPLVDAGYFSMSDLA